MNKILFIGLFLFLSFYSFGQTRVEAEDYTAMSGVSTENAWGDGGGTDVGWIDQGDWMEYVIHPSVTGVHTFIFRLATSNPAAQFNVKKSDGTVLATVNVPNTGGFQQWQSIAVNINLTAGDQTIRIESTATDVWNFNWFEYSFGYKMEAELYSNMSGIGTESTTDANGGLDVGFIEAGDWMDYSVNIATAGTYAVKLRIASPNDGSQLQIKNSSGTVLSTVNIPNTGAYQNWQTVDASITFPSGQQTLRIYAVTSGWNINWWALLPNTTNQSPVVNAGSDVTITLPTNSLNLSGTASDPDGSVASYLWTQVSGPNGATFTSTSTAATTVNSLIEGTYVFSLTVTDNAGATAMDQVTVTVNAAPVNSSSWLTTGNSSTDPNAQFIGTIDAQPLIFKTNNQKQAMLTADGIFTAKKIKVTQSGWADYVFDSTYKLKPLSDVEQFVRQNKHLPDVPSEKQVANEGLNIGDNQAVLLRKIEELTLYVIELNKKVEELSKENARLRKASSKKK